MLSTFSYGDLPVRVVDVDGEPWWVAMDVCAALGIGVTHVALRALDDDEKGRCTVPTPGGDQQISAINEPGLYSLILRSRKPGAKAFRRWITHEVLPTIRKTGGAYIEPGSRAEAELSDPDTMLEKFDELLSIAKAERAKAVAANARNIELEAKVAEDAPKVVAYEQFMDSDGNYSIGAAGKILGVGQVRLFQMLRDKGILIAHGGMRNAPYEKYRHHFKVVVRSYSRGSRGRENYRVTTVRPSGLEFIAKKTGLILPPESELELINA
ncbi:antirepressor [Mycobacterium phage Aegeus]|nr:antirepressor [Mycobacterium phage Baudelaire]WKW86583.1 antirepressor [Mycobacterium phage Aegeus]